MRITFKIERQEMPDSLMIKDVKSHYLLTIHYDDKGNRTEVRGIVEPNQEVDITSYIDEAKEYENIKVEKAERED